MKLKSGLFVLYLLTLGTLSSLSSYFLLKHFLIKPPVSAAPNQIAGITTIDTSPPAQLPQQTFNILLLGHGDAGHDGGNLADSITLLHLNSVKELVALISIPRDLWVPISDNQSSKLNSAFTVDADKASVAKQAVFTATGLTPHYFVSVDFFGLTAIVDELDGIDINLSQPVQDDFYPIRGRELELCGFSPQKMQEVHAKYSGFDLEKQFTCRYEQIHYDSGNHSIDGAAALKLARSRHGSSDFERSSRQQAILTGIKDKLLSLNALTKAPDIYDQLRHTFHTDINIELAASIAAALPDFPDYQITRINLTTDNVLTESRTQSGAFILLPLNNDFTTIHQFINSQI